MKRFTIVLLVAIVGALGHHTAMAQTMNNYTAYPPFINKAVPPAVLLMMTKDHRLFLKGYNDIVDLDGDGSVDTTYKDNIDYVGYFDPKKCYDYSLAPPQAFGNTGQFNPAVAGTGAYGHYCTAKWSGNFLNWTTMARIDIIRKILYGGRRIQDDPGTSLVASSGNNGVTILGRTMTPRDAHSWAKQYAGADLSSLIPTAALSVGAAVTICNTNSASSETVGYMMVLNGNFVNADSTETTQCNPGGGEFCRCRCKGNLSRRSQGLRLDGRPGIQLRYLSRRQYAKSDAQVHLQAPGNAPAHGGECEWKRRHERRHDHDAVRSDLRQL